MGQYKVPQNVEAEDKIIGALTLKQFIYAVIGVMIGLVSFLTMRNTPVVMLIVGVPPTALFLLLGLYQRQDQPFEALFLSLVSFLVKPRKRLWQKEPIEEVFKIEAPKVVAPVTQQDPREIRGQLERLSQIVDTRGWGSKKAELQEPSGEQAFESEGRIVEPGIAAEGEPIETDVSLADDILDFNNNPSAHNVNALIQDQAKSVRTQAIKSLQASSSEGTVDRRQGADQVTPVGSGDLRTDAVPPPGSMYRPDAPGTVATTPAATPTSVSGIPVTTAAGETGVIPATAPQAALSDTPAGTANLPASEIQAASQPPATSESTSEMTTNPLDGILKAAMENDDLPVSAIAAQANRQQPLAEGRSVSLRENGKR